MTQTAMQYRALLLIGLYTRELVSITTICPVITLNTISLLIYLQSIIYKIPTLYNCQLSQMKYFLLNLSFDSSMCKLHVTQHGFFMVLPLYRKFLSIREFTAIHFNEYFKSVCFEIIIILHATCDGIPFGTICYTCSNNNSRQKLLLLL